MQCSDWSAESQGNHKKKAIAFTGSSSATYIRVIFTYDAKLANFYFCSEVLNGYLAADFSGEARDAIDLFEFYEIKVPQSVVAQVCSSLSVGKRGDLHWVSVEYEV